MPHHEAISKWRARRPFCQRTAQAGPQELEEQPSVLHHGLRARPPRSFTAGGRELVTSQMRAASYQLANCARRCSFLTVQARCERVAAFSRLQPYKDIQQPYIPRFTTQARPCRAHSHSKLEGAAFWQHHKLHPSHAGASVGPR